MFDFHEDDSEVVNEEHGVHHAVGVRHQILILDPAPLLVEHSDTVKEPEGKDEDKQEGTDASSE